MSDKKKAAVGIGGLIALGVGAWLFLKPREVSGAPPPPPPSGAGGFPTVPGPPDLPTSPSGGTNTPGIPGRRILEAAIEEAGGITSNVRPTMGATERIVDQRTVNYALRTGSANWQGILITELGYAPWLRLGTHARYVYPTSGHLFVSPDNGKTLIEVNKLTPQQQEQYAGTWLYTTSGQKIDLKFVKFDASQFQPTRILSPIEKLVPGISAFLVGGSLYQYGRYDPATGVFQTVNEGGKAGYYPLTMVERWLRGYAEQIMKASALAKYTLARSDNPGTKIRIGGVDLKLGTEGSQLDHALQVNLGIDRNWGLLRGGFMALTENDVAGWPAEVNSQLWIGKEVLSQPWWGDWQTTLRMTDQMIKWLNENSRRPPITISGRKYKLQIRKGMPSKQHSGLRYVLVDMETGVERVIDEKVLVEYYVSNPSIMRKAFPPPSVQQVTKQPGDKNLLTWSLGPDGTYRLDVKTTNSGLLWDPVEKRWYHVQAGKARPSSSSGPYTEEDFARLRSHILGSGITYTPFEAIKQADSPTQPITGGKIEWVDQSGGENRLYVTQTGQRFYYDPGIGKPTWLRGKVYILDPVTKQWRLATPQEIAAANLDFEARTTPPTPPPGTPPGGSQLGAGIVPIPATLPTLIKRQVVPSRLGRGRAAIRVDVE